MTEKDEKILFPQVSLLGGHSPDVTALMSEAAGSWILAREVSGDAVAEAGPDEEDTAPPAPPPPPAPTPPPPPPPPPPPLIVPLLLLERVASFTSWNFSMNCMRVRRRMGSGHKGHRVRNQLIRNGRDKENIKIHFKKNKLIHRKDGEGGRH